MSEVNGTLFEERPATAKAGYKHASLAQRAVIVRMLDENWDAEAKWYKAGSGLDDAAVAKAVGCGKASVRNMRQAMYPNPRVFRAQSVEKAIDERVAQLEAKIAEMEKDFRCCGAIPGLDRRLKVIEAALT